MKKTFKFFAAALAIVAAASCAKEISNDNIPVEDAEKLQVTVTASYDVEGDTKAILAADKKVHWSDDDAIVIYRYNSDSEIQSCSTLNIDPSSNDNDPTFAVFTGELIYKKGHYYYAAYPGEGWSADYMRFDLGLARQNAVKGSFDPKKYLALADGVKNDSYDHYVFHNACALLKVTVGFDNVYSVKVEGKYVPNEYSEYGIGQQVRFSAGGLSVTGMQTSNMAADDITLSNADGSALENGATYYIVVPHVTIKNFKVSLCDANGNIVESKSKASDFIVERNKIYDLGSFTKAFLGVDVTSINISPKGGSQSINVNASGSVVVSSSESWLTVTYENSQCTISAQANVTEFDRSAVITISCEGLTKEVKVSQSPMYYKVTGNILTKASDLLDGHMYIATLQNGGYSWKAYDAGLKMYKIEDAYQITAPFVYVYHRDDNESVNSNYGHGGHYSYMSAGSWKSRSIDKFLGYDFKFTSTEVFFTHMNGWRQNVNSDLVESRDFDIYKDDSAMLNYKGSFSWGNLGTEYYKWNFQEVVEK